MQFNWRGLTDRMADLAALGFQRRRDVRRPRRSRMLRLQTEALESRNMLASFPLLATGSAGHLTSLWRHTAAPVAHHSAPAHISSTSSAQTSTTAGTLRLSGPSSSSAGATLAVGTVSIQGGTTINTGTLTLSAANTYTGGVLVQNGSFGTGTATPVGGTLAISSGVTNTGTISLTGGAISLIVNTGEFSAPTLGNNSNLTISGGTLRFNTVNGPATIGTGVTATVSGTGTLELAGTVLQLSPVATPRIIVASSSGTLGQLSTTGPGEAGWLCDAGSTIVNSGATLTANHIVPSALVINNAPFNNGIVTISASDASGNPVAGQLQLAQSLAPPADASTLTPPITSASPSGAS